ncbi:hypothetical protein ABPG74_022905 [Tetrahymena malaccensis]
MRQAKKIGPLKESVKQYPIVSYTPQARVGRPAPLFCAMSYDQGNFRQISLEDYLGQYVLLFFYPFDFTFVCPTEIISFSDSQPLFKKINCQVLGCSIDSHFVHSEWVKTPKKKGGLGSINIPLLSDMNKQMAKDYGVLIDEGENRGAAYRGTFIIDKKGIIRHISINDLPVGRNIDEYLRLVEAFQFTDEHGEVCPAKWKPGGKGMVPNHQSEKLKEYWEKEFDKK